MSWSIKLFSVKGIDVKVHFTFVLILIWAAYRWSGSTGAGLSGALFGIVVTLLLFVSVTLHEFGHSLQARKYGVSVRGITLMPLGGVAQMDAMPEKPGQELRIALAGPLVNFAIAALLGLVGLGLSLRAVGTPSELIASLGQASWAGMLAYLTMTNLALGLFNLVPAFPMDGGRILRALLAMKLSYAKATAIAAQVGQGLAFLFGLWGFGTGNYTLVLIAIFVWMGAGGESEQVQVKSLLGDTQVGQAMTRQPLMLTANDPLSRAVELTLSTAQSNFPVMDSGRLVGVLAEGDLLKGLRQYDAETPVGRVMRKEPLVASPRELLFDVQQRMAARRVNVIPVVERDGGLVGLLTAADINEAYRLLAINRKPSLAPHQAPSMVGEGRL